MREILFYCFWNEDFTGREISRELRELSASIIKFERGSEA